MSKQIEKITGYTLIDFIEKIVAKTKEGFEIEGTNQGVPQSWGPGLYTCEMSKAEKVASASKQATVETSEDTPEDTSSASEDTPEETEKKPTTRRRKKTSSK